MNFIPANKSSLTFVGLAYVALAVACSFCAFRTYGLVRDVIWTGLPILLTAGMLLRWQSCGRVEKAILVVIFFGQCFLTLLTDWAGLWGVIADRSNGSAVDRIARFEEGGTWDFLLQLFQAFTTFLNFGVIFWFIVAIRRCCRTRATTSPPTPTT